MKILSKILLVFILGGIVFLNTTCTKQKLFGSVVWEGHVYDKNGNPVKGTYMQLKACSPGSGDSQPTCKGSYGDFSIGSCETDASGYFHIKGRPARTDNYFPHVGNLGSIGGYGTSASGLKSKSCTEIYLP